MNTGVLDGICFSLHVIMYLYSEACGMLCGFLMCNGICHLQQKKHENPSDDGYTSEHHSKWTVVTTIDAKAVISGTVCCLR